MYIYYTYLAYFVVSLKYNQYSLYKAKALGQQHSLYNPKLITLAQLRAKPK